MRYLFGFLAVCALSAVPLAGCTDDGGDGGTGGTAGGGGMGGSGGPSLCDGVRCFDGNDCTKDVCNPADGMCDYTTNEPKDTPCWRGLCPHEMQEPCGVCDGAGTCVECNDDEQCDDFNDCTSDTCDPANSACNDPTPVANGTECAGGTCQDGACELTSTVLPCTEQGIRNAIAAGGGPYTFDCDGPTTVITKAEIAIENDVILDGEGNLEVDGDEDHGVFSVPEGVTADLRGFAVTRAGGTGIANNGTLSLTNTTVRENLGSGLSSGGPLMLVNSTVSGNDGVGIGGQATVVDSAIEQNRGGGIFCGGDCTLIRSTVSGNGPAALGGAVEVVGSRLRPATVTIVNSTVSANDAFGIYRCGPAAMTITNTTVSENRNGAIMINMERGCGGTLAAIVTGSIVRGDCSQALSSGGYNIESPGDTCGFDQPTDQVSIPDPMLGPLQDNGGPTQTHALLPGSVAIDQIPAVDCVDAEGAPLTTDQRGEPRPETGGTMCDVGAFEVQP